MRCCDSLGAILNTSAGEEIVFASEYCPPIITFDILEDFQSFLRWGTLFTGGKYSLRQRNDYA